MDKIDSSDTGRILTKDGDSGSANKLLLALVVIAILLASVALIVALISFAQNGGASSVTFNAQQGLNEKDAKIWTIAVGHHQANVLYIDQPSGQVKGFIVDMTEAVCRLANKNCRLVYDIWQRCWDSEKGQLPRGGVGLMSGWYDACAGWIKSTDRVRTFDFSQALSKPLDFKFVVKTGNPSQFNPTDVSNKKFGFPDGFINDEFCVARQTNIQGSTLPVSQIFHYPNINDVFDALQSGEIDVSLMFAEEALPDGLTMLDDPVLDCSLDASGGAMMIRKDSAFLQWWDPAIERLRLTSEYRQICDDVKEEHGHMPGRDPKGTCIGY